MNNRSIRRIWAIFAIMFLVVGCFAVNTPIKRAFAATKSRAECVLERSSSRILRKSDEGLLLPMASTTKILTASIIIDDCNLDEEITVTPQTVGVEGSSVYLKAGDVISVRDLLYGLMLRSGNDCAETLAVHHSGSISAFAQKMNERASALGAEHSRFVNPHGLPAKGHCTTACDLARISAYALENPTFCEIVSCKYYVPRGWQNKNKMLYRFEGASGVKTGFTMDAGRCLVTSAERNGMKLVCVVLNSPQMFERSEELLNDCFAQFSLVKVFDCEETIEGVRANESFFYPLSEEEKGQISVTVRKNNPPPTTTGEIAGQMQITLKNNLIFSQNLYMM